MIELFTDHTFRTVFLGTTAIGAISGGLGCFAYLRRQSLIGDVVSHSTLAGIMLFFLCWYGLTGSGNKSLFLLIPGAILAGVLSLLLSRWIVGRTRIKPDAGLGVMLAIFFAPGVLLLRWIQRAEPPVPGARGLQDYLFGMAASMTRDDLWMIGILGLAAITLLLLFWKEFKVYTFDSQFACSLGFNGQWIDTLLLLVLVLGIVVGVQTVGVVLMVALLITPACAARQWTGHLGTMIVLAAALGALCGGVGSIVSATQDDMPTGPVIVLVATAIFVISIIGAPRRGAIARLLRQRSLRHSLPGNEAAS